MTFDDDTEAYIAAILADAPPPPPEVIAIFRPAYQRAAAEQPLADAA